MIDRVSQHPGRVLLTPVSGNTYDLTRADDPLQEGTRINKALLDHVIAAYGTTAGNSTAYTLSGDGGFTFTDGATVRFKLHTDSGNFATLNVDGTGAKPLMVSDIKPMSAGIKAGTWLIATYSSTFDSFIISGGASNGDFRMYRATLTTTDGVMRFTLPANFKPTSFLLTLRAGTTSGSYSVTTASGAWFDDEINWTSNGAEWFENIVAAAQRYTKTTYPTDYRNGFFIRHVSGRNYEITASNNSTPSEPYSFGATEVIYFVVFGFDDFGGDAE